MHELQTVALRTAHKLTPPAILPSPNMRVSQGSRLLLLLLCSFMLQLERVSRVMVTLTLFMWAKISVTHSSRLVLFHFIHKYSSTKRNVCSSVEIFNFSCRKNPNNYNTDVVLIHYTALNLRTVRETWIWRRGFAVLRWIERSDWLNREEGGIKRSKPFTCSKYQIYLFNITMKLYYGSLSLFWDVLM